MEVNPNLKFLRDNYLKTRIFVLQGSTRSGKTYSVIQFLIELCYTYQNAGMVITIARATYPSLRGSVMRDFFQILSDFNGYSERNHNKTESTYQLMGNMIEFISLDQPQKIRGRKRDIVFINEANEITLEGFNQLLFRTTAFCILDFNPSDPEHWIYDDVQTREDCKTLVTTYLDNPHLPETIIAEIERFKKIDPDYWAVYGEGKRAAGRKGQIFRNFQKVKEIDWNECSTIVYGLDFGFSSDPTACVKLGMKNDKRYIEEIIYEKGLTIDILAKRLKAAGVQDQDIVICDSSEPRSIIELNKHGIRAVGVKKGPDSVRAGINELLSLTIFATESSSNFWQEVSWYAWDLDKNTQKPTDKPIDAHNHLMDALRYANTIKKREIHI